VLDIITSLLGKRRILLIGYIIPILGKERIRVSSGKEKDAHTLLLSLRSLMVHHVTEPITLQVDQICHLAFPASPPHYHYNPVKTIKTSTMGTLKLLGLAKRVD